MSAAVVVTSCGKDDDPVDPGPTLNLKGGATYTSADATVQSGSVIRVRCGLLFS
jgi:hypothetical protein